MNLDFFSCVDSICANQALFLVPCDKLFLVCKLCCSYLFCFKLNSCLRALQEGDAGEFSEKLTDAKKVIEPHHLYVLPLVHCLSSVINFVLFVYYNIIALENFILPLTSVMRLN